MKKVYYGNVMYHGEQTITGARRGYARKNHKYIRREVANGKYKYIYAEDLEQGLNDATDKFNKLDKEYSDNYATEESRIYKRLSKNGRKVNPKRVRNMMKKSMSRKILADDLDRADQKVIDYEDAIARKKSKR